MRASVFRFPATGGLHMRCHSCHGSWFRVSGSAAVAVHYDAIDASFIDDVEFDESLRMVPSRVECMDCGTDCPSIWVKCLGSVRLQLTEKNW